MTLQWQPVELKFGASQDESAAPFALPQPLLQKLQNARVMKTGETRKRPGWAAGAPSVAGETVLAVDDDIYTIRPRGVAGGHPLKLGSLNQNLGRVDYHDGATGAFGLSEVEVLERTTVMRDSLSGDGAGVLSSSNPDFCIIGTTGIAVIAWEVATPATPFAAAQHVIFAMAIDVATLEPVTGPKQISTGSGANSGPMVVNDTASTAVVVYARGASNEVRGVIYDTSTRTWGTDTVITNDLNVSCRYDVCEYLGSTGWFIAYRNTTPVVKLSKISGVTVSSTVLFGEDTSAGSMSVMADATTANVWIAWYDATNGVRAMIRSATTLATTVLVPQTIEAPTDTATQMSWSPGVALTRILCWTTTGVGTIGSIGYGRKLLKYRTMTSTGTKGAQLGTADVELISKLYNGANGFTYAAVLYDAADTSPSAVEGLRSSLNQVAFTMAICDTSAAPSGTPATSFRVVATWAIGEAGRKRLPSSLSSFRSLTIAGVGNEQWFMLAPEFDPALVGSIFMGRPGVDICRQRVSIRPPIFAARIGNNVVFSGGVPSVWDGANLNEYGFLVPPENAKTATTAASGALGAGAYGVQILWEYRTAHGDVVRSAPAFARPDVSSVFSTTTAAGDKITVTFPSLNLTRKYNEGSPAEGVLTRLFRTEANGTIYYAEGDFATASGFAASIPTPALLTATIVQSDTIAIGHENIYTTGDILPNFPPPALSYIFTHRNRLFGIVAENRRQVVFTHEYIAGELPGWHPDLVIDVPDEAVALATIDEKLVILCKGGIYLVAGNGPDRKGLNSDYDQPFKLNTPHGCLTAESAVSFPNGVMYLAPTGFCSMDRQTTVTRVGGPVEDTLALYPYAHASVVFLENEWIYWSVVDAPLLENATGGRVVCYDWRHNAWSVDIVTTPGELAPAVAIVTSFAHTKDGVFSTSTGLHIYEHSGFQDPEGAWIYMVLSTALFSPGSLQGFARARWLTLLGQSRGIHALELLVTTYSNSAAIVQTQAFFWVTSDFSAMSSYTPKAHLANQVGAFFQVQIGDQPDPSFPAAIGDSASFIGMVMDVGLKSTTTRNIQASMR